MPIPTTDMKLYYSGGSSKSTPDGNQGGAISSVAVVDQDLTATTLTTETIWKNVTFAERTAGVKKYHCLYLQNNNISLTATGIKLYIDSDTTGPDSLRLGYAGTVPNMLEQALGTSTTKAIYDVPLNSSEARMDNDRTRAGQAIDSTRSNLYGIAPIQVDVYLTKHGNPSDATGVKCFVKNLNSETTKVDFGAMVASTVSTTSTLYTFQNLSNTYQLKLDDVVCFEYKSGDANNYIAVNRNPADPYTYSHQVNYDGSQWRNVPDFDICMKVYVATSTGGVDTIKPDNVDFSNPTTIDNAISLPDLAPGSFVGFWLELTVPTRSAYFLKDKSEITVVYNS